jgi:hypothetical protein
VNHKDGYGKTALDVATNVEVKAQLLPEYSATRMLRAHVAFECATAWSRLGVRVAWGRRPRGGGSAVLAVVRSDWLRNPSGIPEEVADWAALAYLAARALAPICHLRQAVAGVCASLCGGGASYSKTIPEYSATRMLRAHVAFDCATAWTRLGVCVALGWRPRGRRQGWLACAAGGGGNFD